MCPKQLCVGKYMRLYVLWKITFELERGLWNSHIGMHGGLDWGQPTALFHLFGYGLLMAAESATHICLVADTVEGDKCAYRCQGLRMKNQMLLSFVMLS